MADQTPLDPDEAVGLIPKLTHLADLNFEEARNILEALQWIDDHPTFIETVATPEGLKELHKLMFSKVWTWAGQFRQTHKSIGIEAWRISTEMTNLCQDVETWLKHSTYPPEEVLARFHHRLVWIHPFPNGNGRWARLAADLLALREEWAQPTWGARSQVGARDAYLRALRRADINDFTELVAFIRG